MPPPTTTPNPPLTLDILLTSLTHTLFHPFIALLLPLCLRALATPYTSPPFLLTSLFAACVNLTHLLSILNHRLTHGRPRPIDWPNEIVLITGGGGGLGGCIAEIFALRGWGVVVVDVVAPTGPTPATAAPAVAGESGMMLEPVEKEGVLYYNVDITCPHNVERVWDSIEQTLGSPPTVLVNNAAIAPSGSVVAAQEGEVRRVFAVNAISQFETTGVFLRRLLLRRRKSGGSGKEVRVGGTIVTVASVLGYLGAANLGAYCASKAALLAFHATLRAELKREGLGGKVKMVLVAPGQLDTQLFGDVGGQGWVRRFFGPVVGAGEVARRVVEMVGRGEGGEVRVPVYAAWVQWVGVLPGVVQEWVRGWSGVDEAVKGGGWGREGEDEEGEGKVDEQEEGREGRSDDGNSDDEYG